MSDSNNDLSYWLSRPPVARIAALEHLREQYSLVVQVQMEPTHNFHDFVKAFNASGVVYMVAGGFAVALYGYPRYTGDIDIWIDTAEENASKALKVLYALGYSDKEVNLEDLTTSDIIVQLGYPPNRIDLTTGMAGVDFASCWENRVVMPFGDTMANFISLNDLRKNKKATARQQDLLDLQNLPE
ncbi:hypothetical protein GCM10027443_38690 [Pontibacter brevis]